MQIKLANKWEKLSDRDYNLQLGNTRIWVFHDPCNIVWQYRCYRDEEGWMILFTSSSVYPDIESAKRAAICRYLEHCGLHPVVTPEPEPRPVVECATYEADPWGQRVSEVAEARLY